MTNTADNFIFQESTFFPLTRDFFLSSITSLSWKRLLNIFQSSNFAFCRISLWNQCSSLAAILKLVWHCDHFNTSHCSLRDQTDKEPYDASMLQDLFGN